MLESDVQPHGLPAGHATHATASASRPPATFVWSADPQGQIRRPLQGLEEFTGLTFAQYGGEGWLDALHPDDRARVARAWQSGVASKGNVELTYRLRRRDGAWRDVVAPAAAMQQDGQLREWVGVCVDVTASLRDEAALRQSEERLRFLDQLGQATRNQTEATAVMGITARLLGEYLGATRCAYADVDADSDRFTIRSDWSLPGVESSAGVYSLELFGPRATSNLRRGEHLVVGDVDAELGEEGGARMFNAIGIKAIICCGLVKDGRLVAMMAVHQATPRHWTAREVALVQDVVERSWAHIERVRDSAMLREQDRRKDEFLATLAHELRNPLAPIKYAVSMLRLAPEPQAQTRAQEVIDRQVSQMSRLIDDLLDLSRINRGQIQLQREPVRLRALLDRAAETARPAIESSRHELSVQLPDEDLLLQADPARIVQVIGNLLNNAAKYTPDGGRIVVTARRSGNHALLDVVDNGIGIPPDQHDKLFQMFSQVDHTSVRGKGGLGIGLALVRTLVQMHGGTVRIFSAGQRIERTPRAGGRGQPRRPRDAARAARHAGLRSGRRGRRPRGAGTGAQV